MSTNKTNHSRFHFTESFGAAKATLLIQLHILPEPNNVRGSSISPWPCMLLGLSISQRHLCSCYSFIFSLQAITGRTTETTKINGPSTGRQNKAHNPVFLRNMTTQCLFLSSKIIKSKLSDYLFVYLSKI